MPLIHGQLSLQIGPVTLVRFNRTRKDLFNARRAGRATPPPVEVPTLIDTGAEQTVIDRSVLNQLGVAPKQFGTVNAPALGGFKPSPLNDVSLQVLHASGGAANHLTFDEIEIVELHVSTLGYQAVLGRDVLAQCVLIYDGTTNSFTLAY